MSPGKAFSSAQASTVLFPSLWASWWLSCDFRFIRRWILVQWEEPEHIQHLHPSFWLRLCVHSSHWPGKYDVLIGLGSDHICFTLGLVDMETHKCVSVLACALTYGDLGGHWCLPLYHSLHLIASSQGPSLNPKFTILSGGPACSRDLLVSGTQCWSYGHIYVYTQVSEFLLEDVSQPVCYWQCYTLRCLWLVVPVDLSIQSKHLMSKKVHIFLTCMDHFIRRQRLVRLHSAFRQFHT